MHELCKPPKTIGKWKKKPTLKILFNDFKSFFLFFHFPLFAVYECLYVAKLRELLLLFLNSFMAFSWKKKNRTKQNNPTHNFKYVMNKNYTAVWWETNSHCHTWSYWTLPLEITTLCHTWKHRFRMRGTMEIEDMICIAIIFCMSQVQLFPDNVANEVIIYTTILFQKHVHRSSLNNHSLKINQAVGTSEWAVQEECMSDRETDPPRHSRKWWEEDGCTDNRNQNLDKIFGLIRDHPLANSRKGFFWMHWNTFSKYLKERYSDWEKCCLLFPVRSALSSFPHVLSSVSAGHGAEEDHQTHRVWTPAAFSTVSQNAFLNWCFY